MTYARDPHDTDEPPCFCPAGSPHPRTTEEFCPAHGDPAKPAPEPPVPDWHGLHVSEMTDAQIREMAGAGTRAHSAAVTAHGALAAILRSDDDFARREVCSLEDADLDRLREAFGWLDTECCEELRRRHS